MRWIALLLLAWMPVAVRAQAMPSLERLFSRPYLWGTRPSNPAWSKNGETLVFLWNEDGRRFLDLYAWSKASQKLTRLTSLESQKDDLNLSDEEKDERLKRYLPPPAGLASFDVSSDGRNAAFAYKGDLYLASTDASRPLLRLTRTKPVESSPRFSPDGSKLASIRGGQVIVQDAGSGQIWQATDIETGNLTDYEWSSDGKNFLYRVQKASGRQLPFPNLSGKLITAKPFSRSVAGDEPAEIALHLVSTEGGKARAIDRGGDKWTITQAEWAPNSQQVLVAQISPDWKKRRILTVDPATAKAKQVFEETDSRWVDYGFAGWSEDSSEVLFTSEKDGWAHLWRVGSGGGDLVRITSGPFEIRRDSFSSDPRWADGWIWYNSTEGDSAQRHFFRIRPDGTAKERLSSGDGLHIGIVSEDGRSVATMRADEAHPFDLWVNTTRVTNSTTAEFRGVPWPSVRYVRLPSRVDGKPVAAKLLLPPGFDPAKRSDRKWPAVVYVHGAGIATSVLKQWGSYNDLRYVFNAWLTSRGYVVLDIDYRGSTGYGRDWRSDVYLHMGGRDLDDVLGGVDYLRGLGNIDEERLGIWGVSYGGFMTAMALFQSPGTFKAGSAWAGVYDWENYNAGYTAQRLNSPASNPEAYRRSSPLWFSNNLKDPLLIVHGMVDNNVLFQDAVQLTEKLIQEGKQFEHIYYPEESHGFVRDETWIDAFRRTWEWFERYLK